MKIRTFLIAATTFLCGASGVYADNVVSLSHLTRQFSVITNTYDQATVGGTVKTDIAVFSMASTAAIDPTLNVSGYNITSTTFKGLPWNSPFQQTSPNLWTAAAPNNQVTVRLFIDLSTTIGKAMYANMLMAMETRALVSIAIDYSQWVSGVGYRITAFSSEQ